MDPAEIRLMRSSFKERREGFLEKCALLVFVFNKATNLDVVGENSLRTWIKSFRLLQFENEEMEAFC